MRSQTFFAALLAAAAPAFAHHSFMAEYDAAKRIRIEGVIHSFDFVNPHAQIELDAGEVCWRVELASPAALLRRGVSKTSLRKGMRVSIDGYASKDGAHRVYGLDLIFAGGEVLRLNAPPGSL